MTIWHRAENTPQEDKDIMIEYDINQYTLGRYIVSSSIGSWYGDIFSHELNCLNWCYVEDLREQDKRFEELQEKLDVAVEAFEEIELYRYDVNDIDQEDWFKIATSMAKIAKEALAKIKEIK